MARPRREQDYTALYVRIPTAEAEKLHRAADVLGRPKRELITKLVAQFDPDDPVWTLRPVWQAAAAAGAGRVADARAALVGWRMSALPELHDLEWVVVAAVGVTAAGTERQRADCYARLAPYAGTHVVVGGCAAYYGPVDHHLGLLADALGRTADAAAHRRAALAASDRLGTPAWTATTRATLDGASGLPAAFRRDRAGRIVILQIVSYHREDTRARR